MTDYAGGAILVGVDGSPNAGDAAAWAFAIGRRANLPIKALAAWTQRQPPYDSDIDDPVSQIHTQTAGVAAQSLLGAGLDGIEVITARGPAAEVLLETADRLDASVLVVGTRGLGPLAGLLLGSISRRLLFTSHRPVVVVPFRSTQSPPVLNRILVGVDCSPVARRVLSWSAAFCARLTVPATIVRCADPGCEKPPGHVAHVDGQVAADAEEALTPFRDQGVEYTIAIAHCDPRVALPETAESERADLIVIGRRGEGRFRGLGGTASYLARHSSIPLAVVPDAWEEAIP